MTDRLDVATRKGLFHFRRSASGWSIERTSFLADPVTIVSPDAVSGSLYAALNLGHFGVKLHRSTDDGVNWHECACPEYPPKPDDVDDVSPMQQQPVPWKLMQIWALEPGHATEPGVLWCGTIPGGLFRSTDRGDNWEMVRSLWDHPGRKAWSGGGADFAGIHSICVDPRDASHVSVGVSIGGVWVTRDGGETWNCQADGMWASYLPPEQKDDPEQQDPHLLVMCRDQPDNYWVQHHNGVFRSQDNCAHWTEVPNVPPSVFGFAVAVHPRDPETAWFVPAEKDEKRIPVDGQVVVARTRDGGKSFDQLRTGLPQAHAYDLTFRHALDIDPSGERLAFGSTTGSPWLSEDQGDSWQCLSEHLPPIYCVRFVG